MRITFTRMATATMFHVKHTRCIRRLSAAAGWGSGIITAETERTTPTDSEVPAAAAATGTSTGESSTGGT